MPLSTVLPRLCSVALTFRCWARPGFHTGPHRCWTILLLLPWRGPSFSSAFARLSGCFPGRPPPVGLRSAASPLAPVLAPAFLSQESQHSVSDSMATLTDKNKAPSGQSVGGGCIAVGLCQHSVSRGLCHARPCPPSSSPRAALSAVLRSVRPSVQRPFSWASSQLPSGPPSDGGTFSDRLHLQLSHLAILGTALRTKTTVRSMPFAFLITGVSGSPSCEVS